MSNVQIIIKRIEFDYDIDSMCGAFSECRGATVHALVRKRNGASVSMTFPLLDYPAIYDQIKAIADAEWDIMMNPDETSVEFKRGWRQAEKAHPPTPFVG